MVEREGEGEGSSGTTFGALGRVRRLCSGQVSEESGQPSACGKDMLGEDIAW